MVVSESVDFSTLTPREQDVMDALIATDGKTRSVAAELGVSEKTVDMHMSTIMLRTRVHSRVQLAVAWAKGMDDGN